MNLMTGTRLKHWKFAYTKILVTTSRHRKSVVSKLSNYNVIIKIVVLAPSLVVVLLITKLLNVARFTLVLY